MKFQTQNLPKILLWLLVISLIARGFLAGFHELGNDEVYYWTYAQYPDWSHFDHPGMTGWMMQVFSLNLLLDSEFFLRLSSIILMTIDTFLFYLIGKELKNQLTGLYSALLYTASLYGFVITGVFIMPDTPLMLFSLLALYLFIKYFKTNPRQNYYLILGGLSCGLAMLSKYSGAFLLLGLGLYILFFQRQELRNKFLYLSVLLALICLLPIVIWNIQNDFVSFNFHGDRVSWFGKPHLEYLGREIFGELLYNNPIVYVLIIVAIIAFFRHKLSVGKESSRLLLLTALPLIGLFIYFSFTRPTLPHWSAPGVSFLIPFAAAFLDERQDNNDQQSSIPVVILLALGLMILGVGIGSLEIKTGKIQACLNRNNKIDQSTLGKGDITLDIYGWKQMSKGFDKIRKQAIMEGKMKEENGIVALNWFPAANMDYYIATPLHIPMFGLGDISQIHKYQWINEIRGNLQPGHDYWFLNQSCHSFDIDNWWLETYFEEVVPIDTITIDRSGKPAEYVFVYRLKNYKKIQQ